MCRPPAPLPPAMEHVLHGSTIPPPAPHQASAASCWCMVRRPAPARCMCWRRAWRRPGSRWPRWTCVAMATQARAARPTMSISWRTTSRTSCGRCRMRAQARWPAFRPAAASCCVLPVASGRTCSTATCCWRPYLHRSAPTNRDDRGQWVSVGSAAVHRTESAQPDRHHGLEPFAGTAIRSRRVDQGPLTSSYSYTLARAFGPHDDYQGDIRGSRQPVRLLAGSEDELFDASRYASTFSQAGRGVPVTVVDGVNHMGLTLDKRAMPAIIDAAGR